MVQGQLVEVENEDFEHYKNKEIDEIVEQTKALAAIFKEVSLLVIEQGTIVD